jgi:intraflagellar transport protein 56
LHLLLLLLQAVVAVSLGQASGSQEQLAAAQQHFRVVGSSASECDTIPGRQAMASCFFLMKLYEDVLVFLNVSAPAKQGYVAGCGAVESVLT